MNSSENGSTASYQSLVFQTHDIEYNPRFRQPLFSLADASGYVDQFLAQQNQSYVAELKAWSDQNPPIDRETCLIFVVCRGEGARLSDLVSIYDELLLKPTEERTNVVIVLNASQEQIEDKEFRLQSDILQEARTSRPWMHVIEKRFPNAPACLGRARKYGLDYCLLLSQMSKCADPIIISNEGDMVGVNELYLTNYRNAFDRTGPALIQGSVEYPHYCATSRSLDLFLTAREAVHHGQGRYFEEFPGFLGILPVGRNFAVSSSVAAAANSIDPIRRKETDDDMNFGADIFFLGGHKLKHYIENSVITSPRREIEIVSTILSGDTAGTQNAYENFHGSFDLYRKSEGELAVKVSKLSESEAKLISAPFVLNSYYSWLFRSRMIEKLSESDKAEIDSDYSQHSIGYWRRERRYFEIYSYGYEKEKAEAHDEAKSWLKRLLEEKGVHGRDFENLSYVE